MSEAKRPLPQLGVTTGDPAGVGPEISLLAAQDPSFVGICRMILFGGYDLLHERAAALKIPFRFERISEDQLNENRPLPDRCIVDIPTTRIRVGVGSKESGDAAAKNVVACASACGKGLLDAMVTAPLSKKFFQEAGYNYPGHTEFLAHLAGVSHSDIAMAFLIDRLKVVLATIHIPLRTVPDVLTPDLIYNKLRLMLNEFPRLGLGCSSIAVAGVNPHAGEAGVMGSEDEEKIAPAVLQARREFPRSVIEGPLPADTIFWRAFNGEFDAVLAMYHDQGLAPIKLIGFGETVNVSLGLPFIRTSVDHGTAFDIAGKGIARYDSMNSAIRWAIRLWQGRSRSS